MDRVGERHKIPLEQRRCRICGTDALETAEHLVSSCTAYAELRQECTRRLEALISEAKEPAIEAAIRGLDASLFLSDRFLLKLGPELRWTVDAVICDFLKLLWRKRSQVWTEKQLGDNLWSVG